MENVGLPIDANNKAMQLPPAKLSLARTIEATLTTAVDITLNSSTEYLEITALSGDVLLKYGTAATLSDFDEFIKGTRQYVIPAGITSISIIEKDTGAAAVVIEK